MPENPDPVLVNFGKSVIALADLLAQNPSFGAMEQMLIENHLHILHMAYRAWKRRQDPGQETPSIPIYD
jgi:hypothetical protein